MKNIDAYKLEMIAIIGMLLSHTAYAFWDMFPQIARLALTGAGGVAFITTAFLLVEGYRYTSNLKRYMIRLLMFGLIATPFHIMVIGLPEANILFSLAAGLGILWLREELKHRWLFWVIFVVLIIPVSFMTLEFYAFGVTTILLYHTIKNEKARRIVPPIFLGLSMIMLGQAGLFQISMYEAADLALPQYSTGIFRNAHFPLNADFLATTVPMGIVIMLCSLLTLSYNGQRGKKSKYKMWFYWVYPGHLALLAILAFLLT